MNKQSQHCYSVLIKALKESDLTYKEMSDISGFTIWWLIRWVKQAERDCRLHICGYHRDSLGRERIKVFRLGKGKAAVPQRLTGAERQRLYKKRLKLRSIPISLKAQGENNDAT